jgi:tRNA(fMet)-specific endonuclease VapC
MLETESRILVDTDVVSYFLKQDSRADYYKAILKNKIVAISFITLGELYFWAAKNTWGDNRIKDLEDKIKHYVILPYDKSICRQYAVVRSQCEINGIPVNYPDYWVAACALRYNLPLATNNVKHFNHIDGIILVYPQIINDYKSAM